MSHDPESPELASTISSIQNLTAAIAEAEAQIADSRNNLASAKEMLASVLAEPMTSENKQRIDLAKQAWQASIEAEIASIMVYQNDVDTYTAEIDAILHCIPEARRVH